MPLGSCFLRLGAAACFIGPLGCSGEDTKSPGDPIKLSILGANVAYYRSGDHFIAGQPTEEGFQNAKEEGIKTVINLRSPKEQSFDEKRVVEGLGLSYVNIPVTLETLDASKAAEFLAAVKAAEKPILIHCASANRASAFWAIELSLLQGVPSRQALERAEKSGLKSEPLKKFVQDYLSGTEKSGKEP